MKKQRSSLHRKLKTPHEDISTQAAGQLISYDGEMYDKLLHAWIGKSTGWLSPASLGLATFDWVSHLAIAPAKQWTLVQSAGKHLSQLALQLYSTMGFQLCQIGR